MAKINSLDNDPRAIRNSLGAQTTQTYTLLRENKL